MYQHLEPGKFYFAQKQCHAYPWAVYGIAVQLHVLEYQTVHGEVPFLGRNYSLCF